MIYTRWISSFILSYSSSLRNFRPKVKTFSPIILMESLISHLFICSFLYCSLGKFLESPHHWRVWVNDNVVEIPHIFFGINVLFQQVNDIRLLFSGNRESWSSKLRSLVVFEDRPSTCNISALQQFRKILKVLGSKLKSLINRLIVNDYKPLEFFFFS